MGQSARGTIPTNGTYAVFATFAPPLRPGALAIGQRNLATNTAPATAMSFLIMCIAMRDSRFGIRSSRCGIARVQVQRR